MFTKTFKPFVFLAGLFTASAGLLAVSPESIAQLFALEYMQEYRLLIQHWGFTTLLIGLSLILSIYKPFWQESVFLIAGGEKLYMVTLVVYNKGTDFSSGFVSVAAVDLIISVYLLSYLYWLKKTTKKESR